MFEQANDQRPDGWTAAMRAVKAMLEFRLPEGKMRRDILRHIDTSDAASPLCGMPKDIEALGMELASSRELVGKILVALSRYEPDILETLSAHEIALLPEGAMCSVRRRAKGGRARAA